MTQPAGSFSDSITGKSLGSFYRCFDLHLNANVVYDHSFIINQIGNIPGQSCSWLIEPSSSGVNSTVILYQTIALSITHLDLEEDQSFIRVYNGRDAKGGELIGQFTGRNWTTADLPSIIFSASSPPVLYITFHSSLSSTLKGMYIYILYYSISSFSYVLYCISILISPSPMILGDSFAATYTAFSCENSCSNRGICIGNNKCNCNEGYTGSICENSK